MSENNGGGQDGDKANIGFTSSDLNTENLSWAPCTHSDYDECTYSPCEANTVYWENWHLQVQPHYILMSAICDCEYPHFLPRTHFRKLPLPHPDAGTLSGGKTGTSSENGDWIHAEKKGILYAMPQPVWICVLYTLC